MTTSTTTKPRVLLCRTLPPQSLQRITTEPSIQLIQSTGTSRAEFLELARGVDGILVKLTEKVDDELLDAAGPQLKVISTMSVGYDHINVPACKARGVRLGNTPDVLTDATAELTIGLLLATARRFGEALRAPKTGDWQAWTPTWMCGTQLTGKTVGLVGFGRIGVAVAERLQAFKLGKLLYASPSEKPHAAGRLNAVHISLPQLLAESDIVIVTCALTEDTKHLFCAATFSQMKSTAIFINTARGQIVKQDDLADALKNGTIAAAGLDVTDPEPLPCSHELLQMDNAVVLPHIGSATIETREAMANLTIDNLLSGLAGGKMPAEI
ncbi:hypothetical protein SpCBS45565_g00292 [Spizellomyces sp. 'palustris']|nr:hypothetical protein SpCBS45565_g00292 [Spizellomyces sp. 'palustris']